MSLSVERAGVGSENPWARDLANVVCEDYKQILEGIYNSCLTTTCEVVVEVGHYPVNPKVVANRLLEKIAIKEHRKALLDEIHKLAMQRILTTFNHDQANLLREHYHLQTEVSPELAERISDLREMWRHQEIALKKAITEKVNSKKVDDLWQEFILEELQPKLTRDLLDTRTVG